MRSYKKFVYRLSPEEFYDFLAGYGKGVEVLSEGESSVEFALYEPCEGFEPLEVLEVEIVPPERSFRAKRIGNIMVLPAWLKPVVIRQGVAFGTGLHATTRLCLQMLQKFLQPGWSVLDVGAGTGILAIASKRLGAGRVLAIDIDPLAVEECVHNARENCLEVHCERARPEDVKEEFDLLVANLELEIFRGELVHIERLFKRVGIFSGLYGEDELQSFLEIIQLKPAKIKRLEDWYCVVVRK